MSGFRRPACAPTGLASNVIAACGRDSRMAWIAGVVTSTSPRLSRRTASTRAVARRRGRGHDAVDQCRRTTSSHERQDLDLGADLMDRLDLGQGLGQVVTTFDVDMGTDRSDQLCRGVLIEENRVVDNV